MTNRLPLLRKIILAWKYPQTTWRLLKSRYVDKFKLHQNRASAPDLIVLHVSETCNLRCPMCLIWESRSKFGESVVPGAAVTLEDVKNIVNQLGSAKPIFYLVGGEPTLNRDLLPIVKYIHQQGMITSLTTNGWLLEDFAQPFFDSGLEFISISLDGPKAAMHDKNRGVVGSFERSLKGIKKLVEIKKQNQSMFPNIKINTVVTPWNVDELENTIALAKTLGVDELSFENFSFFGKKIQEMNAAYVATKKTGAIIMGMPVEGETPFDEVAIQKIARFFQKLPELSQKYDLPLVNIPSTNNHEQFYRGAMPLAAASWCYNPWHTATIRGAGDLELCQGYILGNIRESKLLDLWNNDRAQYFRNIIKTEHITPACYRCCNLNSCFKKI